MGLCSRYIVRSWRGRAIYLFVGDKLMWCFSLTGWDMNDLLESFCFRFHFLLSHLRSQFAYCLLKTLIPTTRSPFSPQRARLWDPAGPICAHTSFTGSQCPTLRLICHWPNASHLFAAVNHIAGRRLCFVLVRTFILRHASQAAAAVGRTEAWPVLELASVTFIIW